MAREVFSLIVLLLLSTCIDPSKSARILFLTHTWNSHIIKLEYIAEGLVKRGHDAYIVLSDKLPQKTGLKAKGIRVLTYHSQKDHAIYSSPEVIDATLADITPGEKPRDYSYYGDILLNECLDMDRDLSLYLQLKSLDFNLAIINFSLMSGCLMLMAEKLKIPFILNQVFIEMDMMRTPALPSFTPSSYLKITEDMTFYERLLNSYTCLLTSMQAIYPIKSIMGMTLLESYNTDPNIRSWKELAQTKADLFFVTQGPALEYALPVTPNIITLECLTCKPAKALSKDIELLLQGYEDVVLVAFGSGVDKLPVFIVNKFLKSFEEMKGVLFIWRYKGNITDPLSQNVKLMTWIPQNDLLAHPKTKLFITHSGNNGQHESLYHGVPMLGFSFYKDQLHNAQRVFDHGYGLMFDIQNFSSEEMTLKMKQLLYDSTFREKTRKASRILKNAPMTAVDKAAFWTEHVLEFGSDHLKPNGLSLSWYSYYMIDILISLQFALVTAYFLLARACRLIITFARVKVYRRQRIHPVMIV